MLAKKLKARIRKDKKLILHIPDMPEGEVEVIILKKEKRLVSTNKVLLEIPKHKVGEITSSLRREDIYTDGR